MAKEVSKSPVGRPTKYTPTVVTKLKAAFANSFTVDQACLYAGITKETFYQWLDKRPEFTDQMTKAREAPTMKAKEVVVDSVRNGDVSSAKWWLERKAPEEFSTNDKRPTVNISFNQHVHEQREKYDLS